MASPGKTMSVTKLRSGKLHHLPCVIHSRQYCWVLLRFPVVVVVCLTGCEIAVRRRGAPQSFTIFAVLWPLPLHHFVYLVRPYKKSTNMSGLIQIALLLLATNSICSAAKTSNQLISLHEENWTEIMKGEWMVEFHAPWCPACKDLQKAWNAFADWSKDLNIKVGEVDVTVNPGLSGRFLVTALPTIYHVKDGVFRVYTGPRDKNDFITFIEDKRWRNIDPVPDYKHPNSRQMAVVAVFFKLSMAVRDLHNHLVEVKGVPSWVSYSLFAGVTLALGCILGFFIVLIIDQVFPTGTKKAAASTKKEVKKDSNGSAKKADETKKKDNNSSPKASAETKKSK